MRHRFWPFVIVWLLLALPGHAAGVALTDLQQEQLATAHDGTALDEGALYALLAAAVDWPAFEARGAKVPDYVELMNDPAEQRGQKFLIEGGFVASGVQRLARPGPWGKTLSYWVIKFGDIDSEVGDNIAVVLMVDPQGTLAEPNPRQPVRVPAAFYKVWRDQEKHSKVPTDFLTFVARAGERSAVIVGPTVTAEEPGGHRIMFKSTGPLAVVILVALGAAWFAMRRMLKSMRSLNTPRVRHSPVEAAGPEQEVELRDDLPEDPVEAMAVLQAERDAAEAAQAQRVKKDPVEALAELETKEDADPSA